MLVNTPILEAYVPKPFHPGMLRRYHSQTLSVRNDKRYMPIHSDTKLMFIQDINNLSGGFMPFQGAFLWSDKLL
jgi:hypothetical protein